MAEYIEYHEEENTQKSKISNVQKFKIGMSILYQLLLYYSLYRFIVIDEYNIEFFFLFFILGMYLLLSFSQVPRYIEKYMKNAR